MDPQERQLIQQAQAGDIRAFEALVKKVDRKVLALAFEMLNRTEDAEDVYQDVFMKVYSNLKGFRFQSDFYTWVYRIAVRCAIDYRKKRKPLPALSGRRIEEGKSGWWADPTEGDGDPEDAVLDEELKGKIRSVLESLPFMQRTVLFLRFMEGLPIKNIAEAAGCSQGSVKQHLFRGTRKAKKALSVYLKRS
ncbi:MAG TPA: sigma-70 family RNA polymerase sigma factor [bacterium]